MQKKPKNPNAHKSQGHQNKKTFYLKYYDDKQKLKENTHLDLLCRRCYETLEWKLKYGKYKPLSQPALCTTCNKKMILKPYRTICDLCAKPKGLCTKCRSSENEYHAGDQEKAYEINMKKYGDFMTNYCKKLRERDRRKVHK